VEWISDPNAWIALASLTLLEVVLGIDNIFFLSILAGKLPAHQQARARTIGLGIALAGRIILLLSITWVMGLTEPLFEVFGHAVSGRDLILIVGGLFLVGKATHEIHQKLEGDANHGAGGAKTVTFGSVLLQIFLLDMVFSLDSVITAVGMADHVPVMIIAVVIAVVIMMLTAKSVSEFIHRHPTVKMLALAFLLLVGVALFAEGFHVELSKGYIYSAMGFSIFVELLNMRATRKRQKPVKLHSPHIPEAS